MSLVQLTGLRPVGVEPAYHLGPWCRAGGAGEEAAALDGYGDFEPVAGLAELEAGVAVALRQMTAWLNRVHGLDRDEAYWELLVYRFLDIFASELYFRYRYLKRVLEDRPGLRPVTLDPAEHRVPDSDYEAVNSGYDDDEFNLQMFSEVARTLGADAVVLPRGRFAGGEPRREREGGGAVAWLRRRLRALLPGRYPLVGPDAVVLFPSHFPDEAVEALAASRRYRLARVQHPRPYVARRPVDRAVREGLEAPAGAPPFARCLVRALRWATPRDFVEDLEPYRRLALRVARRGQPGLVVGGFFASLPERVWLAECRARPQRPRLVIVQHGASYGESMSLAGRWFESESRLADVFASWGWGADEPGVTPMPAPRLMGMTPVAGAGEGILVLSGKLRPFPPIDGFTGVPPLGELQAGFFDALDPRLRACTVFRGHPRDARTLAEEGRWDERYPEVRLDTGGGDVRHRIEAARVVVINYLFSTAVPECLALDRPVLVLASANVNIIHARARPHYQRLREAGIVHECAASAARLLNEVYDDLDAWWNEPARREAVRAYRAEFGATRDGAAAEWERFLAEQVSRPA